MKTTVGQLRAVIKRFAEQASRYQNALALVEYNTYCRKEGDRFGFLWLCKQGRRESWDDFLARNYTEIFVTKDERFGQIRTLIAMTDFLTGWEFQLQDEMDTASLPLSREVVALFDKYLGVDTTKFLTV